MAQLPDTIRLRTGEEIPFSALEFTTSRSGGPGGQNVNKVETKVAVRLQIADSQWLRESTQKTLLAKLGDRIDKEGAIHVTSNTERSQLGNRIAVVTRLTHMLNVALKPAKKRVATKPTRASRKRRLEKKKQQSDKKSARRWKPDS